MSELLSESELVYSSEKASDQGQKRRKKGKSSKNQNQANYTPGKGPVKMRLEKKGRGGKQVTVLYDLPLDETAAKALKSDLAQALATGAALKGSEIEIRGDLRREVAAVLKDKSIPTKS